MEKNADIYFDVRNYQEFLKQEKYGSGFIKPDLYLERENGKIIYGSDLSFLGRGENATVWKYESEEGVYAVKIFFSISSNYSLDEVVYLFMKNLPLKNIVKALETLKVKGRYGAYMMRYLEEKKDYSIVDMLTSILLENSYILESDVSLLTKKKIVMQDMKRENSLFNQEDSMLYLDDIDMFSRFWEDSSDALQRRNEMELNFVFYDYLLQYSKTHYHGIYNDLFEDIFIKDKAHKKSTTEKLEYLFSSYETPKQFFKDNKRRYDKKYF